MKDCVFSFDIFDTCISRSCGRPENIFYLLANQIISDADESVKLDFIRERQCAEFEALKQQKEKQDVTIYDIYDCFNVSVFTDLQKEDVIQKEIEIEIQSFAPIKKTLELLNDCRKKGRVIFISDMYLPYSVLYNRLCELGVIYDEEPLYLSNEVGLTKRKGDLFNYVKQREKIDIRHWIHYGDNLYADYYVPRRMSINVRRINYDFSTYESLWENESLLLNDKSIAVFAGLIRSKRLQNTLNKSDDIVFDIMIPFVVSFALSLLKQAKKDEIKRLYFASRDMYVVYLVCKEYAHLFPQIELYYINISTQVLYPTIIREGTKEELYKLMGLVYSFKPVVYLEMFGFTAEEIQNMSAKCDLNQYVDIRKHDLSFFTDMILQEENRGKLIRRCAEKRDTLIGYLQQVGLFCPTDDNVALVDLGWRATSQSILNEILPNRIKYYYYGISSDRLSIYDTGARCAFSSGETASEIFAHREFLEYFVCRAPEGSTKGYKYLSNGKVVPVLEKHNLSGDVLQGIQQNIQMTIDVAKEWGRYLCSLDCADMLFYSCIQRTLKEFVCSPPYPLIVQLAPYLFFSHYGSEYFLIRKISFADIIKAVGFRLGWVKNTPSNGRKWEMASYIYSFGDFGKKLYKIKVYPIRGKLKSVVRNLYYRVK